MGTASWIDIGLMELTPESEVSERRSSTKEIGPVMQMTIEHGHQIGERLDQDRCVVRVRAGETHSWNHSSHDETGHDRRKDAKRMSFEHPPSKRP